MLLEESNLFPAVPDKEELDYNLLGHATIILSKNIHALPVYVHIIILTIDSDCVLSGVHCC